ADGDDRHRHGADRRRPPGRGDVPVRRAAGVAIPRLALLPGGWVRAVHTAGRGSGRGDLLRREGRISPPWIPIVRGVVAARAPSRRGGTTPGSARPSTRRLIHEPADAIRSVGRGATPPDRIAAARRPTRARTGSRLPDARPAGSLGAPFPGTRPRPRFPR